RKKSCDMYFDYAYKLPILLSDVMFLIAFPTRGIDHFECIWIIERNVREITKQGDVSVINFKYKNTLKVYISLSILLIKNKKTIKKSKINNITKIQEMFKTLTIIQ